MNPLQTNPATTKPLKNLPNKPAEKGEKVKGPAEKPEKPPLKTIKTQKNQRTELVKNKKELGNGKESNKGEGTEKPKIDEYLKMISRLENKVKKDEIADEELEKVIKSLEEKILSLDDQQKLKLKNLKFFKKQGIENVKTLKKTLENMFHDEIEQKTLFDFLKSQEFITVLLNGDDKANTYTLQKLTQKPVSGPKLELPSPDTVPSAPKAPGPLNV